MQIFYSERMIRLYMTAHSKKYKITTIPAISFEEEERLRRRAEAETASGAVDDKDDDRSLEAYDEQDTEHVSMFSEEFLYGDDILFDDRFAEVDRATVLGILFERYTDKRCEFCGLKIGAHTEDALADCFEEFLAE